MRIRAVSKLIGGEILAEAILTREKEILIPKGTELKSEYIPLIQSLEIESLMLEDPYEDYEKPHFISQENSIKKYTESVRKLMEGHIYHENDKSLKIFEVIAFKRIIAITKYNLVFEMLSVISHFLFYIRKLCIKFVFFSFVC